MTHRMKRLAGKAVHHFSRLTRSGKAVCRRMLPFTRKDPSPPAQSVPAEGEPVPVKAAEPSGKGGRNSAEGQSLAKKHVQKRNRKDWSLADFEVAPLPGRSRFHDFPIDLRLMRGIASQKFQYCTPIQEKALPIVLASKDLVCRAQTGTGKTAVFLVGLYCRLLSDKKPWPVNGHPRALIIAPTRELVIQIASDGKKLGAFTPLTTCAVYGGADYLKQQEMVTGRRCDIVVATPGRLLDFVRKQIIFFDCCTSLVIDEADRMLDMGFIPDVRRILGHLPSREKRQTMLFSATITDDVRRLASQWCTDPVSVEAGEEAIDVERIEQRVYLTTEQEKFKLLYNLAARTANGRILVFTNMKSEAADLAAKLQAHGISCLLLTGDVPQYKRTKRLESFRSGKNLVLVATDVAGRGIHIDDIQYVVNYTLPYEPEDYVHRIGRTGRAGADGVAISFACESGSFYLPAIEEFIGRPLECIVPDDDLLCEPPEPKPTIARSGKRKYPGRRRRPSTRRRR